MNYFNKLSKMNSFLRAIEIKELYAIYCNDYNSPRDFAKYLSCSIEEAIIIIDEGREQYAKKLKKS